MKTMLPSALQKSFVYALGLHVLFLSVSISGLSLSSTLIFISFLATVFWWVRSPAKNQMAAYLSTGIDWALLGYTLIGVIGAFALVLPTSSSGSILKDFTWVPFLYALVFLMKAVPYPKWSGTFKVWWPIVILVGLYAIVQFFTGVDFVRGPRELKGDFYRSVGLFDNPMTFSYNIGMAAFLASGFLIFANNKKWWPVYAAVAGIGFLCVFTSLTRGAWLGLLGAGLLGLFFLNKKWGAAGLAGAAIVGGILLSSSNSLRERVTSIADTSNASNSIRLQVWQANWEMFKDHPLLGVGFGQNSKYLQEYYAKLGFTEHTHFVGHAHNNYLQMLSGMGIFGLGLYLIFCVYFMVESYRLFRAGEQSGSSFAKALGFGGFFAQLYFHIGGVTEANFIDSEVNFVLLLIWAATVACRFQIERSPEIDRERRLA